MLQTNSRLVKNTLIRENYFQMVLNCPDIAKTAKPGQFIEIKVSDGNDPLLRRPISIHRVNKEEIVLFYEVVGKATELLSRKKTGDFLDIIGPLGNGFSICNKSTTIDRRHKADIQKATNSILVAGGMGVAPLLFLSEKIIKRTTHDARRTTKILIGGRTKSHILCEREFKHLGCEVKIATEDGSKGFKGYVTDLLTVTLSTMDCRLLTIYACGPKPMLEEISRIAVKNNIATQVSLEAHMACGIGACLGCVVKTNKGFKRVCKEGPVFEASEIIW